MALGEKIVSVYNGAADKSAFEEIPPMSEKLTHKAEHDLYTLKLHEIYHDIRTIRESQQGFERLPGLFTELKSAHGTDWLASLEILEISVHYGQLPELENELRCYLAVKAASEPEHTKLINDGLNVIANPVTQLITEEES